MLLFFQFEEFHGWQPKYNMKIASTLIQLVVNSAFLPQSKLWMNLAIKIRVKDQYEKIGWVTWVKKFHLDLL